ncbi:tumor necrosis factor receptor superfamily member 1A isoform 1-T1 [Synchiropus picturatus]
MGFSSVLLLVSLLAQSGKTVNSGEWQCNAGSHCITTRTAACECRACKEGTFTDRENMAKECQRCGKCEGSKRQIQKCNTTSDTVCECTDEFYDESGAVDCRSCGQVSCKECEKNANCWRKCNMSRCVSKKTPVNNVSKTPSVEPSVVPPTSVGNPAGHWVWVVMLTSVLALYGFLLCIIYFFGRRCNFRTWCVKHSVIRPSEETYGPPSLPSNSVNTLVLTLSETSPMMTLSPQDPVPDAPASEPKMSRDQASLEKLPPKVLYDIIKEVPLRRWKEFLRLLSVTDQQMDRVEVEAGLGLDYMEKQYQMLKIWNERSSSKIEEVFSVLHCMNLASCAEMLRESLKSTHWTNIPTEPQTIC